MTAAVPKFLPIFLVVMLACVASAQTPTPASFFGGHEHRLITQNEAWPAGPGSTPIIGSMRTWDMESLNGWYQIETARGVYNWTNLDNLINQAQQHGADIVYTFGWTPSWAVSGTCHYASGAGCADPPASMTYWDEFLTALATHAKGKIGTYEVWNEPNVIDGSGVGLFWNGDVPTLVTMTQHAQSIIKGIDPAAKITTPTPSTGKCSTASYVHPGCWLNDFFNSGGGAYVDVITFHGYTGSQGNPGAITTIADEIVTTMNAHGQTGKPMWDTESSQCSGSTSPDFVGQFELLHVFSPISRHYWYAWDDGSCGPLWSPSGGLNGGGVAFAQVYNWIVGSTKTQSTCSISGTLYTCSLALANGDLGLALWNTAGSSSYTPPVAYTQYKDLSGNTHAVSGAVTIGVAPVLFVSPGARPSPPTGLTATVK